MSVVGKISLALLVWLVGDVAFAATDRDLSAQRRPRITVYPRPSYPGPYAARHRRPSYPGPYATRHCDSWLEKEYRVSGTVVVPRMRCFWR